MGAGTPILEGGYLFRSNLATDVQTGPNGDLFLVSLTNGAIYEISRR